MGHPPVAALFTPAVAPELGVGVRAEIDSLSAVGAIRRLERWRVVELLEVVPVGSVPNVDLRVEGLAALPAVLPRATMPVAVMVRAERVPSVPSKAAVPRSPVPGVDADPVAAALRLGQSRRFSAQAAPLTWRRRLDAEALEQ